MQVLWHIFVCTLCILCRLTDFCYTVTAPWALLHEPRHVYILNVPAFRKLVLYRFQTGYKACRILTHLYCIIQLFQQDVALFKKLARLHHLDFAYSHSRKVLLFNILVYHVLAVKPFLDCHVRLHNLCAIVYPVGGSSCCCCFTFAKVQTIFVICKYFIYYFLCFNLIYTI